MRLRIEIRPLQNALDGLAPPEDLPLLVSGPKDIKRRATRKEDGRKQAGIKQRFQIR